MEPLTETECDRLFSILRLATQYVQLNLPRQAEGVLYECFFGSLSQPADRELPALPSVSAASTRLFLHKAFLHLLGLPQTLPVPRGLEPEQAGGRPGFTPELRQWA